MSKYFKFDKTKEYSKYKEYLDEIRSFLEQCGELACTNEELNNLWCEFSEECYSAQFLIPERDNVLKFAHWLDRYDEKETI